VQVRLRLLRGRVIPAPAALFQKSRILDGPPVALTLRRCLETSFKAHSDRRGGESGSRRLAGGEVYQSDGGRPRSAACGSRL